MEGAKRPGSFIILVRFLVASGADTNEQKNEQEQANSPFCIFKNSDLKFNELRLLLNHSDDQTRTIGALYDRTTKPLSSRPVKWIPTPGFTLRIFEARC